MSTSYANHRLLKKTAQTCTAIALGTGACLLVDSSANAQLTYYLDGVPSDKVAAIRSAMDSAVAQYNEHGGFTKNLRVYYSSGIPTAQASYNGDIGFGGTINSRVALHEISHTIGVGTTWGYRNGIVNGQYTRTQGANLAEQFDGLGATISSDGTHFWPYGLNYDSENTRINRARHVAMVYAFGRDIGSNGTQGTPSYGTHNTLTSDDAYGQSSFNDNANWSDGHFAHSGASYSTGNFAIRTPQSNSSFNFAGDSLTLNNTNPLKGLYYKGYGEESVFYFKQLNFDGGSINHYSGSSNTFRLDGNINVVSTGIITATQGNIDLLANVSGPGDLTIATPDNPNEDNRYVTFKSNNNRFWGNIEVQGRMALDQNANLRFLIEENGENNAITGDNALRIFLDGQLDIELALADATAGNRWDLITASNVEFGVNFHVADFTETSNGVWINDTGFMFTEETGQLVVVPEPAALTAIALGLAGLSRRRRNI